MPHIASKTWGDTALVSLTINILILTTLSVSILANIEDAKLFSFGWTYRLKSSDSVLNMNDARDAIIAKYQNNYNSDRTHLGAMLDDIYDLASCKPALYDGGLEWAAAEMSPTCNCLRNLHVEYVKAIHPNGTALNALQMNSTDTRTKTAAVQRAVRFKCFSGVRHTQVDDMTDPYHPGKEHTLHQTNLVVNVLYWNIMGCILSLTVTSLDRMQNKPSGARTMETSDLTMLIVVFVLIMWNVCCYFLVLNATPLYSSGLLLLNVVYTLYCLYHLRNESMHIETANNPYPTRKSQVFWTNYTLVIPTVVHCLNMLLQRRDVMLNWVFFWAAAIIGMCNMGVEMIQTSFNYTNTSGIQAEKDKKIIETFLNKKNYMIRLIILCIILIVLTACIGSFPVFPWVPFSNMYSAMAIVTFLIILPVLSSGRHLMQEDKAAAMKGANILSMDMGNVEMAARLIFTVAALCDIWSVRVVDNIVTSL